MREANLIKAVEQKVEGGTKAGVGFIGTAVAKVGAMQEPAILWTCVAGLLAIEVFAIFYGLIAILCSYRPTVLAWNDGDYRRVWWLAIALVALAFATLTLLKAI